MKKYGYWQLQLLFFLVISGLWFFGVFTVYVFEIARQIEDVRKQEGARSTLLQQYREGIRLEYDALPAYHRKLELLEAIHSKPLKQLRETFFSNNLREDLQQLQLPFEHASGLFVTRRGRLLYQDGLDMEYLLGKDWLKRILPGLNSDNDELFNLSLARMYTYPISRQEFLAQRDRFLVLNYRSRQFLRFYSEVNDYSYFFLIDIEKVSGEDLLSCLDDLIPPIEDKTPDFLEFLGNIWPVHLLSLLALFWLWGHGGYLIISTRFTFRLMFFALVFWLFFLLLIHWLVEESLSLMQDLENSRIESAMRDQIVSLEQDFIRFTSQMSREVAQDFFEGRPFDSPYWSLGLSGIVVHQNPYRIIRSNEVSGGELGVWSTAVLENSILGLMAAHFYNGLKSIDDVDEVYQIRKRGDAGLASNSIQAFLNQKVIGFVSRPSEEFYYFDVMQNGMFGSWLQTGNHPDLKLMALMIPEYDLVRIWMDTLPKRLEVTPESMQVVFRNFGVGGYSLTFGDADLEFSAQETDWLWQNWRARTTNMQEFTKDGRDWLLIFGESETFRRMRIMVLRPKGEVEALLLQNRELYKVLVYLSFFLFVFIGMILTRRIQNIVYRLREGFKRFSASDWAYRIPESGADEGEETVIQFNRFLEEVSQMQKLLPFVSPAVLAILGSGKDRLKENELAVMLFSDIRSFTTISESSEPEEVVAMLNQYFSLWQSKIDRYGGVVERFVGDAIRVVFFASRSRHFMQDALQAALEVSQALPEMQLKNGCGLAFGEVNFQMVGDEHKMEFLAFGEAVRQCENLEKLSNEGKHTKILVDGAIASALKDSYSFSPVEEEVFELIA